MKTHFTSVVVIPPESRWEPIQEIRRQYDKKVDRWMPHINLLYPFHAADQLEECAAKLSGACARLAPFEMTLGDLRHFDHGRDRYTIWLEPSPPEPLIDLQATLQEAFPECDDVASFQTGFLPHLSVGQALGRHQLQERLGRIRETWTPLAMEVKEIAIIVREDETPFRVEQSIPLGG